MIIGGVSISTLNVILQDKEKEDSLDIPKHLSQQSQKLLETALTSFFIGLIVGGIRRAIQERRNNAEKKRIESEKPILNADFFKTVELCRNNTEGYPSVAYAVKLGRHDVVKFLLDNNESANLATSSIEIWDYSGFECDTWKRIGTQTGYSPLELAIMQNDVEMVKILTSYNPNNCANITFNITRYPYAVPVKNTSMSVPHRFDAHGREIYTPHWSKFNYIADRSITTTPLSQAIALGNKEMIETIFHAYSNSESLAAIYEQVRATQQESIMRLWIEQQTFLWKGKRLSIADETVKLFLSKSLPEAIQTGNASLIKQYLDNGWLLTKSQATQILATKNSSMVELLKNGAYLQKGVNPLLIAVETGSLDLLKSYISQGYSLNGILLHAVQNKQKTLIEYLLKLSLSQDEIIQAHTKAYQIHAYDIMDLLEKKKI